MSSPICEICQEEVNEVNALGECPECQAEMEAADDELADEIRKMAKEIGLDELRQLMEDR